MKFWKIGVLNLSKEIFRNVRKFVQSNEKKKIWEKMQETKYN